MATATTSMTISANHSTRHYIETPDTKFGIRFKVYHYNPDGMKEIVVHLSDVSFSTPTQAEYAAVEWCNENNINAEIV